MPTIADHCMDHPEEFYNSCGVSRLHNHPTMNAENVKENDIVFIKTDEIFNGNFQKNILPRIKNKFVLISGISSYSIDSSSCLDIINNNLIKYWFCTNPPNINSDKLVPLPIGFEEKERDGGNQEILRKHWNNKTYWGNKSDLVYLPYHTMGTNPKRDQQIRFLESLNFVYIEKNKLPFDEYLNKMDKYKFIICLAGAGHDTHRNYESLLVGSVPIMINSPVKKIYDYYELPSVFLDNWASLSKNTYKDKYSFDTVKDFLNIGFHTERVLRYAKS